MLYYIGCRIPRGADCDDGWKCRKGEFCSALEICSVEDEEYKQGWRPCFGYYENGEHIAFFHDSKQSEEYYESIKTDHL